jgi:hypothetical protein
MRLVLTCTIAWGMALTAIAAEDPAAPRAQLLENPGYRPPAAGKRGKEYRPPGSPGYTERSPVIWAWRLETPDGAGLTFGGLSIRTDDPRPPTMVKRGGAWVSVRDELRKKNLLQPHSDRLRELRPALHRVSSLARHIYFEGRDEAAEKAFLDKEVAPKAAELLGKLKEARAELAKAGGGDDKYLAGQVTLALAQLDKVAPAVEGVGSRTTPEKLAALRAARQALEWAADLLDCEPPGRALAMPAWDAKSGLFVVFGGDHLDYLSNELWTFDPKETVWRQRHPKPAPEPRGDHVFESAGDGKIKMRAGYVYHRPTPGWDSYTWVHAGADEWVYDLAADSWTGPAGTQAAAGDERFYRPGGGGPDNFTAGPRPDAAAHAQVLAALPANTWVDLKPPKRAWGRDWGTMALDPDRDMIYWYSGGHCVYSGADVLHYHMATGRWDQPVETELGPGYMGGGESIPGWTFNRRAWICGHSWNSYGYDPELKRMVVNGRQGLNNKHHDPHTYVYDPDLGDWEKRGLTSRAFDVYGTQVRFVPGLGMITWAGAELWKLDDATLDWKQLPLKGKVSGSRCDFSGLVYDPGRKRELLFSGGDYNGTPFSGEVFAVAVPSLEASSFKPEGSEHIKALYAGKENSLSVMVLREIAYHPGADLFLFGSKLPGGYMMALDAKGNRWVGMKIGGTYPWGLSAGLAYDAKRDLFFALGANGEASALRLDAKTVVVKTLAEIVAEAGSAGKPAGK